MKNQIKILLGLLILSLVSCEDFFETTLEIDPPPHEESLVVFAWGSTRSNELNVRVSKSVGIFDSTDENSDLVNDATVELISDSETFTLTSIVPTQFVDYNYILESGTHEFQKGVTYQIRVNAPGFDEATGSARVPFDIDLTTIEYDSTLTTIGDGEEYTSINTVFTDPEGEANFYEVGTLLSREIFNGTGFEHLYTEFVDPVIEYGLGNLIFKDDSFDGLEKNIRYYLPEFDLGQFQNLEDHLYLNWRIISEDHYKHSRSVESHLITTDNPFASPVQVFSNIDGGFGLFSIFNESYIPMN